MAESQRVIDLYERDKRQNIGIDEVTAPPLQTGGGGGTFGSMSEVDAKIAAAEARTQTGFERILSEIKQVNMRIEHVEKQTSGIKTTVITTAIATSVGVLALTVAIMAYGAQWFGLGMDANSVAQDALKTVTPQIEKLDTHYRDLSTRVETMSTDTNAKFETILKAVQDMQPKVRPTPSPLYQTAPAQN